MRLKHVAGGLSATVCTQSDAVVDPVAVKGSSWPIASRQPLPINGTSLPDCGPSSRAALQRDGDRMLDPSPRNTDSKREVVFDRQPRGRKTSRTCRSTRAWPAPPGQESPSGSCAQKKAYKDAGCPSAEVEPRCLAVEENVGPAVDRPLSGRDRSLTSLDLSAAAAQAEDRMAGRHHATVDACAGVHAATGGAGFAFEAAPDPVPWPAGPKCHATDGAGRERARRSWHQGEPSVAGHIQVRGAGRSRVGPGFASE